jgi:putative ATP-dependent endonuclease of OLD family
MKIKNVRIKNYRLLKDVSFSIDEKTTLIVGRNNTGKTSFAEAFRSFLNPTGPKVRYEDFNQSCLTGFEDALNALQGGAEDDVVRPMLPTIELELLINYQENADEYGVLGDFIIDFDDQLFETIILISYQLKDGKISDFFSGLDSANRKQYFTDLRARIEHYYEATVYAVEPTNLNNKARLEFSSFKKLLLSGLINAQRGLDDETHNERDVLGKSLGNIFKSASSVGAPEAFKAQSNEINTVVEGLQQIVDTDFQQRVQALLPTLNIFGYPGLHDPNLSAATELNVKSLLESHTRVYYQRDDHFTLPETYNGLGMRNLIFILFRIYEYFREFQSHQTPPKGHVIFIEEPEAHLHPQMQEVFIRQLELIVGQFQRELNDQQEWPVQFIVSTHSSHIANEADFSKVRYFLSKNGNETKVKDLGVAFRSEKDAVDREFLHKYLTLTKCDLYFADRAILVEGATERILLPQMIKKVDSALGTNLRQKYLSVVEIGGAYAHHFYKFIDFLELKTLFITDLDSVDSKQSHSAVMVSFGDKSSNVGISKWFGRDGYSDLATIRAKDPDSKVFGCRRLAFQIDEDASGLCGRSFEDAFILANCQLFQLGNLTGVALETAIFDKAKDIGKKSKADFAIEYCISNTDWLVPKYIQEGFAWLDQDTSAVVAGVQP